MPWVAESCDTERFPFQEIWRLETISSPTPFSGTKVPISKKSGNQGLLMKNCMKIKESRVWGCYDTSTWVERDGATHKEMGRRSFGMKTKGDVEGLRSMVFVIVNSFGYPTTIQFSLNRHTRRYRTTLPPAGSQFKSKHNIECPYLWILASFSQSEQSHFIQLEHQNNQQKMSKTGCVLRLSWWFGVRMIFSYWLGLERLKEYDWVVSKNTRCQKFNFFHFIFFSNSNFFFNYKLTTKTNSTTYKDEVALFTFPKDRGLKKTAIYWLLSVPLVVHDWNISFC